MVANKSFLFLFLGHALRALSFIASLKFVTVDISDWSQNSWAKKIQNKKKKTTFCHTKSCIIPTRGSRITGKDIVVA